MCRGSRGRRSLQSRWRPDGRRAQPRRQRRRGQKEARGAPDERRLQRKRAATPSPVRGGRESSGAGWPEVRRDLLSPVSGRPKAERRTPGRLLPLDPNRKHPAAAAASRSGRVPIPLAVQGQSRFLLAETRLETRSPRSSSAGRCLALLWLPSHVRRRVPNSRASLASLDGSGRHSRRSLGRSRAAAPLLLWLLEAPPSSKLLDLAASSSFTRLLYGSHRARLREQPFTLSAAPSSSSGSSGSSTQHP